ncbi:hypothetical protein Tco_0747243, partial [Tanacetum coccineum]
FQGASATNIDGMDSKHV